MKKIILLTFASAFLTTTCFAKELNSFNEIKAAATAGKDIHIVIDFEKCTSPNNKTLSMTGAFTPHDLLIANNRILTSLMHFTLNSPNHTGKPVYEFVKYAIADDNSVQVTHQPLDAVSYAPLENAQTFNCIIDASARFYN